MESNGLSGRFYFSFEFALFILAFSRGEMDLTSESHERCLRVLQRRGCYKPIIANALGYLTEDGEILLRDAWKSIDLISRYNQKMGLAPITQSNWESVTQMDEIIIKGSISLPAVKLMLKLYEFIPDEQKSHPNLQKYPFDPKMQIVEVNDKPVLLTRSVHSNNDLRIACEQLTKFGIFEQINLIRYPGQRGRGRHPVGARLTEVGLSFVEDFLRKEDPVIRRSIKDDAEMKAMASTDPIASITSMSNNPLDQELHDYHWTVDPLALTESEEIL